MGTITSMLVELREGRPGAMDRLFAYVYDDLRAVARRFSGQNPRAGLQATEIVHTAFQRLASKEALDMENRRQFFYVLSRAMHDIFVEQARSDLCKKRGGGVRHESIVEVSWDGSAAQLDILDLQDALADLGVTEPDAVRVVMLRFYAGMTLEEIADTMECGYSTVRGHWAYAKAWLSERLRGSLPTDEMRQEK